MSPAAGKRLTGIEAKSWDVKILGFRVEAT